MQMLSAVTLPDAELKMSLMSVHLLLFLPHLVVSSLKEMPTLFHNKGREAQVPRPFHSSVHYSALWAPAAQDWSPQDTGTSGRARLLH